MNRKVNTLKEFFVRVESDSRITTAHISLYSSLWKKWEPVEEGQPLIFFSHDIMPLCKISSYSTYHKTIRELQEYGYIKYVPSFNRFAGSEVQFLNVTKL